MWELIIILGIFGLVMLGFEYMRYLDLRQFNKRFEAKQTETLKQQTKLLEQTLAFNKKNADKKRKQLFAISSKIKKEL